MPVLHDLPEAVRLRGARQTPKVSSLSTVDLSCPVITDLAPDPAYYTDQPTPVSSGWRKNSASSRAQHQRHRHRLRRATPRLSAPPRRQRRITARRPRAFNDRTKARRAGIRLRCKARGRLRLGLRLRVGLRRLIMGLRVLVTMVLCMRDGIIGGLRLSVRR
jgi:hypothetical protein